MPIRNKKRSGMNNKTGARKIVYLLVGVLLGAIIVMPTQAHKIKPDSKKVTAKKKKKKSANATHRWTKKNFYARKLVKRYWYTKKQSNGKYYTKGAVDTIIANYLTSSAAASTYLTQSSASGTYLTQSNASSTYLPLSGGTLSGALTGASITGTSFSYPSAQTKYKTISANHFIARAEGAGTSVFTYTESGNAYWLASGDVNPMAGVDLPDGATVTGLTLYTYDNSALNMKVKLQRTSLTGTGAQDLAEVYSDGSSGSPDYSNTQTSITNATIDNDNYYYFMFATLTNTSANLTFRAVRITYTTTAVDAW